MERLRKTKVTQGQYHVVWQSMGIKNSRSHAEFVVIHIKYQAYTLLTSHSLVQYL